MPLREYRSFDADGPVGAYWLRNSTGFRVVTPRRRCGWVDEVGVRESDGRVDVIAVRKRGLFRSRVKIVPADRVTLVRPWDQTVVLAPKRRRRRAVAELPAAPVPAAPMRAGRAACPRSPSSPRRSSCLRPSPGRSRRRRPATQPEPTTRRSCPCCARAGARARDPAPAGAGAAESGPAPSRSRPALRTAGAASAAACSQPRSSPATSPAASRTTRSCSCARSGCSSLLALRLIRRHAPTVGRFLAELAAFGLAAVAGLGRSTAQYVRTWRGELADWRATRRWQESRPEPPQQVRPPSPNGSRPGAAPTRTAPPSRRG